MKAYVAEALIGDLDVGYYKMSDMWLCGRIDEDPGLREELRAWVDVGDEKVDLTMYDTLCHPDFVVQMSVLKRRDGFFLVYSVTSRQSFERIQEVHRDIAREKDTNDFPCVVCGNNCHLDGREVSTEEGEAFARSINAPFFETSAERNINIRESFERLASLLIERVPQVPPEPKKQKKRRCCVC